MNTSSYIPLFFSITVFTTKCKKALGISTILTSNFNISNVFYIIIILEYPTLSYTLIIYQSDICYFSDF